MFDSDSQDWLKIRDIIKKGVGQGQMICPISSEHCIETSQKEKNKAIELDMEFYKISGGFSFKSEMFVTSQLIISLIRKNNITLKTYLHDKIIENPMSDEDNFKIFSYSKQLLDKKINECTQIVNGIRNVSRHVYADKLMKSRLIKIQQDILSSSMISRLKELLQDGHIYIRGVHFTSGDVPDWIDEIIYQLINRHRMTPKEAKLIINEIEHNGFNNIPTLNIRSSLSAIIAVNNKNETVNDQIDIMRIATGLPISNIFLTDKQRKHEIIELGLDQKYDTQIFCGTKYDKEKLIFELENILQANK